MSAAPGTAETTVDDVVLAIVRGRPVSADALARTDPAALGRVAEHHGVLAFIADRLARRDDVPAGLAGWLRAEVSRAAAIDLLRERELRDLMAELDRASTGALLMKGAHLAYSLYERPDLRPRLDTDILVPDAAREAARVALERLGYEHTGHVSGALVMAQACYVKRGAEGALHTVDVHWRLANPLVFADVLSYHELAESSVPLPRLSPAARGLSNVHALLVACVHRVAHHFDSDRLIWLYDIHLLASRLEASEWERVARLAADRGVASVCLQSLSHASAMLGTTVPASVMGLLEACASERSEPSAAYLSMTPHTRRQLHVFASDLRALPSWAHRWRLVREHVFPSAQYMRGIYAPSSGAPLPVLYARRFFRGARKWLVRT